METKNYAYSKSTKIIVILITILAMSTATAIFGYSCSDNVSSIEPILEAEYVNSYEHLKEAWNTIDKIHIYQNPNIDEVLYYFEIKNDANLYTNLNTNEPFVIKAINDYSINFGNVKLCASDLYKFIKSFDTHYIINQSSPIEYGPKSNKNIQGDTLSVYYDITHKGNYDKLFVAFTDDYINKKQEQWTYSRNTSIKMITAFAILVIISVISLLWLMYITGVDTESEKIVLYKIDYINVNILFIASILLVAVWVIIIKEFMPKSYINMSTTYFTASFDFIITLIFSSILIAILLSFARRAKAGTIIKDTFKPKVKHHKFYKSLFIKELVFVISEILILISFPFIIEYIGIEYIATFIATVALEILIALIYFILTLKSFNEVEILVKHIDQIYEGNLEYKSNMPKKSLLYTSSEKLENIGEGLQKSVEQQIKTEKMKMDLITNVSHDLKTPLTSIISYIDLLSKEKNISEEERDYIRILAKKSDSLKSIVTDLFDLAKVTSGNSDIKLEKIDMHKLIIQTLADMEDKIDSSKHTIKTILPETSAYILADGKKMYRVFQNIIDNALKYSLSGTRIFIELKIIDNKIIISLKNTSSYEMNFTEDEILERFTRGDKSRTTEGNGLGLSIAQSFTQACGGQFKISIDGDQFKVIISFNQIES